MLPDKSRATMRSTPCCFTSRTSVPILGPAAAIMSMAIPTYRQTCCTLFPSGQTPLLSLSNSSAPKYCFLFLDNLLVYQYKAPIKHGTVTKSHKYEASFQI